MLLARLEMSKKGNFMPECAKWAWKHATGGTAEPLRSFGLHCFCGPPVVHSCLTLCNPMDYSTPRFPVLYSLLEFAQTHVRSVSDAIQPSHPLSPPSPALSIRVFSNESALGMRWPKYWSFSFSISPSNENSALISFRISWFDILAVQRTLKSLDSHSVVCDFYYYPFSLH